MKQADGYPIDLTEKEARAVLLALPDDDITTGYRNGDAGAHVQIFFRGEWHILCRTTLTEDLCTISFPRDDETLRGFVARHVDDCVWGARVGDPWVGQPPRFAVVHAWSDG